MKLKWGILSQKKMRVKLIGGVIREAFEAVRIPGDPDLKKRYALGYLDIITHS
jgi:hypothetical protein